MQTLALEGRWLGFCALLYSSACIFQPPSAELNDQIGMDAGPVELLDAATDLGLDQDLGTDLRGDAGADGAPDVDTANDSGVPDANPLDLGTPDMGPIDPPNRPPVAIDDQEQAITGMTVLIEVLANDSDPDMDPISILNIGTPASGQARISGDLVEYQPNPGFDGRDSFDYTITDGQNEATATITIIVAPTSLTIDPQNASTNLNSEIIFSAQNGTPPYTFSIIAGEGDIDPASGSYFSPGYPGTAEVQVTDSAGATSVAQLSFGEGDLWFMGGVAEPQGTFNDVLQSSDGTSWTDVGNLPGDIYLQSAIVYRDRIWTMGGRNSFGVFNEVYSSADGVTWDFEGGLPYSVRGAEVVVFRRRLYLIGGRDSVGNYRSLTWSSENGTMWTQEGSLPAARAFGSATVFGGEIWYAAGLANGQGNGLRRTVWSSADGQSWTFRGELPQQRYHASMLAIGGRIWFLGGANFGGPGTGNAVFGNDDVWSSVNGATWVAEPDLAVPVGGGSAVARGASVWIAGGSEVFNVGAPTLSQVRLFDGMGWAAQGNLPSGRRWGRMVIFSP